MATTPASSCCSEPENFPGVRGWEVLWANQIAWNRPGFWLDQSEIHDSCRDGDPAFARKIAVFHDSCRDELTSKSSRDNGYW